MANKYDALLQSFLSDDPNIQRHRLIGISKGGENDHELFASNGHICVYVPRSKCEDDYSAHATVNAHSVRGKGFKVNYAFDANELIAKIQKDGMSEKLLEMQSCRTCKGKGKMHCKAERLCDSDSCCPAPHDFECEDCDGSGKTSVSKISTRFIDAYFQFRLLKKILDAALAFNDGHFTCTYTGDDHKAYEFAVGAEISIALMTLRKPAEEVYTLWESN